MLLSYLCHKTRWSPPIAYQLPSSSPIGTGLHAVALKQTLKAAHALKRDDVPDPGLGVYEARKRIKKARSALRLLEGAVRPKRQRSTDDALRSVGRRLSDARDAQARCEALAKLAQDVQTTAQASAIELGRAGLEAALAEVKMPDIALVDANAAGMTLSAVADDLAAWRIDDADGRTAARKAFVRTYAKARDHFEIAYASDDEEAFHDWRKKVKRLWHATRLLSPVWPEQFEHTAEHLGALASMLGENQDLHVLRDALAVNPSRFGGGIKVRTLHRLIAARRARLQERAWPYGARLFAEAPSAFNTRMKTYWKVRRSLVVQ